MAIRSIFDAKYTFIWQKSIFYVCFCQIYANYQLIDPFLLFSFAFIEGEEQRSWSEFERTPSYFAWRGAAFETVCLAHIPQIKHAMGIAAVRTNEFPWLCSRSGHGAQIDLVIERADGVTDLCEIKCTDNPFVVDSAYEKALRQKREVFVEETQSKNVTQIAMISMEGLKANTHSWDIATTVAGRDLFAL